MKEDYKEYYERRAELDKKISRIHILDGFPVAYEKIKMILNIFLMGSVKNKRILDIGCASGGLLNFISGYKEYVGIDISEFRIEEARKRIKDNNLINAEFYVRNVEEPFNDLGTFDCIFCLEVMEHVLSPVDLLNNIKMVSTKDTKILFSTPDAEYHKPEPPEHLRTFNKIQFIYFLKQNGFKSIYKKHFYSRANVFCSVLSFDKINPKLNKDGNVEANMVSIKSATIYSLVKIK